MLFNQEKALVAWNNDNLDTYHDVIVSFDYARFSRRNIPSGGFCVVFFSSKQDVPTIGGPGASLGYLPSSQSDYCFNRGYEGFVGATLGVGFDLNGEFGLKNNLVDGLDTPITNSCSIRGSETENYKYYTTSKNFASTPKRISIADTLDSDDPIQYKSVRIIISKAFSNIEVQIKNREDTEFYTVLNQRIPVKRRTAVRIGITHTSTDSYTRFVLKNFNVAGFPGVVADPELDDCATINTVNNIQGNTIVSANDFCAVPVNGNVHVYEVRGGSFSLKQLIQEESDAYLLGGNERFLFLNKTNTYEVDVYYKASNNFLKIQTIDLYGDVSFDIGEDLIGGYPTCADTNSRFLVVGNNKNVFVWQFFTGVGTFGVFGYTQTLSYDISGGIGYSVQIDGTKMLTGGGKPRLTGRINSFVNAYEYNGIIWDDEPKQTIISPITGNIYDEFGTSISMQGNEAIIGSPNERRRNRETLGHGEAYHYVYVTNRQRGRKEWRSAMGLGTFFNIDTPGGNLGTSVNFLGNYLLVSAPYENYHFPPDKVFEDKPNAGRVYLFRKSSVGTFTQSAILAPDPFRVKENMYFGRYVGFLGRVAAVVGVPYKNNLLVAAELDVYKIGCIFDLPPRHLPISIDSIALYDSSGYTIDISSFTYLQLLEKQFNTGNNLQ